MAERSARGRASSDPAAGGGLSDRTRRFLLYAWVLVTVAYFSWEAAGYRGLYAWATEWQFDRFGQDLPTFTFGLLATLVAWPALRLFRRPVQADDRSANPLENDAADLRAAIGSAGDYLHWLWSFVATLGLAALATLIYSATLPRLEGTVRDVAVSGAEPREGPVRLTGDFGYGRIASFSRGLLFIRRSELYAPILAPGSRRTSIRYFVEFDPTERAEIHTSRAITRRSGILVRNDMPGALVRLYRYLGYLPAKRYYVLYASSATIRWPYYMVALQFGLGALVFAAAALFQQRHLRRLGRTRVRRRELVEA